MSKIGLYTRLDMSQDDQQRKPSDDPDGELDQDSGAETPKPRQELKVNRLKFALILAAILLFALIASNIKEITGG
jgi:hypothetical protein